MVFRFDDYMLMMLISGCFEEGIMLSDNEICDLIVLLIIVGYEIISGVLVWVIYVLLIVFGIWESVVSEVVCVLGGRVFVVDDLSVFIYFNGVVYEMLCLYLFGVILVCRVLCDFWFDGYCIWVGCLLIFSVYVIYWFLEIWFELIEFCLLCWDFNVVDYCKFVLYEFILFSGGLY